MKDLKHLIYFENLLEDANNELVRQAQENGSIVLGYTCYHIPEVLLNVDNCISVRLRAPKTGSLDISTYYMSNYTCDYARALVERAIEGGYQFLDAMIGVDACSAMNRSMEHFEVLKVNSKEKFFVTHTDMPLKVTDYYIDSYTTQMREHVLNRLTETFGVDTSDEALRKAVTDKIFLGFSDTTLNHFMLHKVGLPTFYGQAFLPDVCELAPEMLPYTRRYWEEFLKTGTIREVRPSSVWYESRKEFGPDQVGTELPVHKNTGFELLQGPAQFEGEILGGCIDSMYEMFSGWRHADMPDVCKAYGLFPDLDDWRGKILLLESCEEYMPPETYKKALETLKDTGVFDVVSGVLVGKPMDEVYAAEYKKLLAGVIANKELPIVCNLNIGHALPRCILPFGVRARVDAGEQVIRFG